MINYESAVPTKSNLLVGTPKGKPALLARQSVLLTGRLTPVGARLFIRHSFTSAEKKPLELIYGFGLPRDGAMRGFRLSGPGWVVRSELEAAKKAREKYEEALDKGHRTALAAQHGDGVVNLSLGNIKPGDQLTLWLEMMAGVEATDEGYRFRFPFVLPPRYHAEARYGRTNEGDLEMELPDDFGNVLLPRWTNNSEDVPKMGFLLEADAEGGVAAVSSPSHPVEFTLRSDNRIRIGARSDEEVPDGDLEIHVRARRKGAMIIGGLSGDRYNAVALVPVPALPAARQSARRVVFLIDASGSMEGLRIEQARKAAQACLGLLAPNDQFALLAFQNSVIPLVGQMRDASAASIAAARKAVDRLAAGGGTNLGPALQTVLSTMRGSGGDVVLITDGDVAGTDKIVPIMQSSGIRLHTLGIDTASAERFLEQMASTTGGQCRCIASGARVDAEILQLFRAVGQQMSIQKITVKGLKGYRFEPEAPASASPGQMLPLYLSGERTGQVEIHVEFDEEDIDAVHLELGEGIPAEGELARLLRGARLQTLAEYEREENSRSMVRIGKEYGLANQALSLVAVVKREGDGKRELPKTVVMPSGFPRNLEEDAYGSLASPACAMPQMGVFGFMAELSEVKPKAMFSRSRSAALPGGSVRASRQEGPIDVIYKHLAEMEPDGGLPGKDVDERVAGTLALLLLVVEHGGLNSNSPFTLHVEKMRGFLRAQPTRGDLARAIARVEMAMAGGGSIAGRWAELLAQPSKVAAAILSAP